MILPDGSQSLAGGETAADSIAARIMAVARPGEGRARLHCSADDRASVLNSETVEDDEVLMTITEAGILVCAICDRRAVARLTTEWLCADHVLIELAARMFDDAR